MGLVSSEIDVILLMGKKNMLLIMDINVVEAGEEIT